MVNARLQNAFRKAVETAVGDQGQPATLGTSGGTIFYDDGTTVHKNRVWVRMGADHQNLVVAKAERQGLPAVAGLQVTVVERHGMLYVVDWDQNQAAPAGAAFDPTAHYKQSFTPKQWYPTDANIVAGTTGTNFPFDTWNFQNGGSGTQYLHLIFYPGIFALVDETYTFRIRAAFSGGGGTNTTRIVAAHRPFSTVLTSTVDADFGAQTLDCTGGGRNGVYYYDVSKVFDIGFEVDTGEGIELRIGRNYDHADDTAGDVHFVAALLTIEAPGSG